MPPCRQKRTAHDLKDPGQGLKRGRGGEQVVPDEHAVADDADGHDGVGPPRRSRPMMRMTSMARSRSAGVLSASRAGLESWFASSPAERR